MPRDDLSDLLAFLAVARERSFTRAAAQLGISQSGLSHKIRGLETRMGVRLLTRTTRSVLPTDAGERLFRTVGPQFEAIAAELDGLNEFRDKPTGHVRIATSDVDADLLLWPRLMPLLTDCPDIRIEIHTSHRTVDIVEEQYDLGVHSGAALAEDMTAVRIYPDFRQVIVAAPAYLDRHAAPLTPDDLLSHDCILQRSATNEGPCAWPLRHAGQERAVHVDGRVTFNGSHHMLQAALAGFGLAYLPEYLTQPHREAGRLRYLLEDWCPSLPGCHLYYPSDRNLSSAATQVVEALRCRPSTAAATRDDESLRSRVPS